MKAFDGLVFLPFVLLACTAPPEKPDATPPNIVLVITDDQSWEHVGVYGDQAVRTPVVDRLAREGVLFQHAYTAAPSCSPSRAGLLTGQDIYRLEEGGVLTGFIRNKFEVFPLMLEEAGYRVGSTGKPYWPRTPDVAGAHASPTGAAYTTERLDPPTGISNQDHAANPHNPTGISKQDYAANFEDFLADVPDEEPFFFWAGIQEPHLPHPSGLGLSSGIDPSKIRIPAFYPEAPEVRNALSDYLAEIEWADTMLGRILGVLERRGALDNTLIVFTSDNGMPFPRAKATLYDHGVRMPLIMRWGHRIQAGRTISNPVSLIDLAPTFLELAGLDIPEQMTGRSLVDLLHAPETDRLTTMSDFVVSAFEKHTLARPDSLGFPRRAIHAEEWTYIINYEPERWPAGNAEVFVPNWDYYGDVDPSGIKSYFLENQGHEDFKALFDLSFGRVSAEELYHKTSDPDMVHNLAEDPAYQAIRETFRRKLEDYLIQTNDPRMQGASPWDRYYLDK